MPQLFHNRLPRLWQTDLRQIDPAIYTSGLLISAIGIVGAINLYTAIAISLLAAIGVIGYYYHVTRHQIRSRFFTFWSIWWIVYMAVVIEFILPLLEILPEEHLLLILLSCLGGYFAVKVNQRSKSTISNQNGQQSVPVKEENGGVSIQDNKDVESGVSTALLAPSTEQNINPQKLCHLCHKSTFKDSIHCRVCGVCVQDRYHHNYFLNCCINPMNYRYYMLSLIFGLLALFLAANLMLTTICHPFLVTRIGTIAILLPDDCSNVFDTYPFGVALIGATYALLWAGFILVTVSTQVRNIICSLNRQSGSLEFAPIPGDSRRTESVMTRVNLRNFLNLWRKMTS